MNARYYVQYLSAWFAISGDDVSPTVVYLGSKRPDVDNTLIRTFKQLPENEKEEIEKCHAEQVVGALME